MAKKILLFIDNLGSGGAQRQIVNIALLLQKAQYDVSLLVYQDLPFYQPILDQHGIPVVKIERQKALSRILGIRKYINHCGTDIVIAFLETPGFIACLSKLGHRKWKLVTTERSAKLSTFTSRRNRLFNRFEWLSDAKVGNSENAMTLWRKYYPQYEKKYSVIYNHVFIPDEYLNLPHTYRSNGKLCLTVAASYQELKNPLGVIEAVRMLTEEQRKSLELHWYGQAEVTTGNTKIYELATQRIEEYGLGDCIHLHHETNEIYRIMAESDAVGLFSTVEGLPNTICEGMTLGRPVIMSKVSDYDVLVSENGFLCDPHSVESIHEALVALLEASPEELERMGTASKEKAKRLFSAEAITKQWSELIESLTH